MPRAPASTKTRGRPRFGGALGKDIPRRQEPERVGLDQARLGGKKEVTALNAHRGTEIFHRRRRRNFSRIGTQRYEAAGRDGTFGTETQFEGGMTTKASTAHFYAHLVPGVRKNQNQGAHLE